jgi:hypothetical protein
MGRSMARIAHQPDPVCMKGGVSRWLVGVVVGLGGGAAPAPTQIALMDVVKTAKRPLLTRERR